MSRQTVALEGLAIAMAFTALAGIAAKIEASNLVQFAIPGFAMTAMFWITGLPGDRWRPFIPQRITGVASLPFSLMVGAVACVSLPGQRRSRRP